MPWGVGWGSSPWGDGPDADLTAFSVASALAVSSNTVRVMLTQEPLFGSILRPGDASITGNWSIQDISSGVTFFILAALQIGGPMTVDLTVVGTFELMTYRVTASNIVSIDDAVLTAPTSALFLGMPEAIVAAPVGAIYDIANKQTSQTGLNGHLVNGSSGDYLKESGLPLLKKLLYREVLTAVNAFLHLAGSNYGLGVEDKRLYRAVDLISLQKSIELVAQKQPEVKAAKSKVSLASSGELLIQWKVQLQSGLELPFSNSLPSPGVSF